ncbi:MAG: DUF423 domain-containing protein [Pseudomonadales bacterium]
MAALLGLLGVVLGAYGAHGLAGRGVTSAQLASWQTAVHYHLLHVVAILATTVWLRSTTSSWLSTAAIAWLVGILLFSGSIYVLVLGGPRWLGPITPAGGVVLMAGWGALFVGALRSGS